MNYSEENTALVSNVMRRALQVNSKTDHTVFVEFSGHVEDLEVEVFLNGWVEDSSPDESYSVYLDGDLYLASKSLDNIESRLKELLEDEHKFEVGDYVVCNDEENNYYFTNEDMFLGRVVGLKGKCLTNRDLVIKIVSHKHSEEEDNTEFDVYSKHFRKATPEEIERHKDGNPEHEIEVGDYIKELKSGDILKVVEIDKKAHWPFTAYDFITKEKYVYSHIAINKVELTERELSFVRAGRKVNEVRRGDIVTSNLMRVFVASDDYATDDYLTLVCPVENRTDLKGEDK